MENVKTCCHCKETFPATPDYFNRRSFASDGLQGRCKQCSRDYQRKRAKGDRKIVKQRKTQRIIQAKFGATIE